MQHSNVTGVLYDPDLYASDPVESYWEATAPDQRPISSPLEGEQKFDVAILGGGFTGLSTALHLARDHGVSSCVLEAGHIGWGASGRNGGMVCLYAAKLGVQDLVSRYGLEEAQRFFSAQLEGIELVRELCESEEIHCDRVGQGAFEVAHKPSAFSGLKEYAQSLTRHFGIATTVYDRTAFADVGYESEEQFGAVHVAAGFGLHPLKFCIGLGQAAQRHGAVLYTKSEVTHWTKSGKYHLLATRNGSVRAEKVVMATNGFYREGIRKEFDHRLLPVISNIITTRPLTSSELEAHRWATRNPVFNTRNLLFYFRLLPDNSFLFGARGDTRGDAHSGRQMRLHMTKRLGQVFPQWSDIEISHYWRGLVCMSRKRSPSLGRLSEDPSVLYGYGYHGNGVNTAPWAGKQIATMIATGADGSRTIPRVLYGAPARFPMPALRLWCLRIATQYYKFADEVL